MKLFGRFLMLGGAYAVSGQDVTSAAEPVSESI